LKNLKEKFINSNSKNHIVMYNNKIVEMNYISSQKEQFKFGAMRIQDNLGTGQAPTQEGYIKTPKREFYKIERSSRTAKLISSKEVK